MSDIYDCEYYARCQNNTRCMSCGPTQRLLKLPEDKVRQKYEQRQKTSYKAATSDLTSEKSWEELEQSIANDLNAVPRFREAERQVRSGALWFAPGDVKDDLLLAEAKDHLILDSKGNKTMSIKKDVIDKIIEEAKMLGKYPGFIWRYKGDPQRYAVQPFEDLAAMIQLLKSYTQEIDAVKQERDYYRNLYRTAIEQMKKDAEGG